MQCTMLFSTTPFMFRNLKKTGIYLLKRKKFFSVTMPVNAMATNAANDLSPPTAGIIIIGDEILKGQTCDTNTHFLTRRLKSLGVKVRRVSVIPDEIDTIAEEVQKFSKEYRYVFTSGGVGPTHDDITFEGVAKAFHDTTHPHPTLVSFIERYFKVEPGKLNEGQLKLASIPTTAKLNYATPERVKAAEKKGVLLAYPLTSVQNVFIFPGIPFLMQKAFDNIVCDIVDHSEQKASVQNVYLTASELDIVHQLNHLVAKFKDEVTFGSYPKWTHNYYKTRITVEAQSLEKVQNVCLEIRNTMPAIDFDPNPEEGAMEKIGLLLNSDKIDDGLKSLIKESLSAIEKCFSDYSEDEIMMAVNGGKDCLTMLHLVHTYFQSRIKKTSQKPKIKALYIEEEDAFQEVNQIIDQSEKSYGLDMIRINGPMKSALTKVLVDKSPNWKKDSNTVCSIKACFMGTRKNDPGGKNLEIFSPTSNGWPPCMRVNPILNWAYRDIWNFLRALSLPYPILYDQGFTSLGNIHNTKPNPHLLVSSENGKDTYKPAYTLEDGDWERDGRR